MHRCHLVLLRCPLSIIVRRNRLDCDCAPGLGPAPPRPRVESVGIDPRVRSQTTENEVERWPEGYLSKLTKCTFRIVPLSSRLNTQPTRQESWQLASARSVGRAGLLASSAGSRSSAGASPSGFQSFSQVFSSRSEAVLGRAGLVGGSNAGGAAGDSGWTVFS